MFGSYINIPMFDGGLYKLMGHDWG